MIVPMKKVLLLMLESERNAALQTVRRLGVLEVSTENLTESADRTQLTAELGKLDRALALIADCKITEGCTARSGEAAAKQLLEAASNLEALNREESALRKEEAAQEPWGDYDPEALKTLAGQGIYLALCEAPEEARLALTETLEDAAVEVIASNRSVDRFVIVSNHALDESALPVVHPALRSLSAVRQALSEVLKRKDVLETALKELAQSRTALQQYRRTLASELELLTVNDGMETQEGIALLRGFAPERSCGKLSEEAQRSGWGIVVSDPESSEAVPVLLEPPCWVKPVLPLFAFLGISPGYEEFDLSPGLLIFFSIFFSMIINDTGYGVLMLIASILMTILLRKRKAAALPCKLALILSGCSVIWGACTGSYFGMEYAPLEFFAEGPQKNAHLELVCFILALVHLSLGHFWRLVNANGVREIIGQIGWVPILLLDFLVVCSLLVFPGMTIPSWSFWTAGVGLAMVMIGGVDWKDMGAVCNFPFDLIGSFTDTLSYVRLFAIGMSGAYMASSFNTMGMQLWHISPWLIPVAILVILFGHTLNVALAFMGVLVHGVRLNTLEFSNHAGIRWGGQSFRPLAECPAAESLKDK